MSDNEYSINTRIDHAVERQLEIISVKLDGLAEKVEEKFESISGAHDEAKTKVSELDNRLRNMEIQSAGDRAKLAAIVGGVGIIAGGVGAFILKTMGIG